MTERIDILRQATLTPDGAGGFVGGVETCLFSGMAEVKPRAGTQTADGYQPYQQRRYGFTFYRPAGIVLQTGDIFRYRSERYQMLGPALDSTDRRQWTIEVELI
jgi:hypothetical protein